MINSGGEGTFQFSVPEPLHRLLIQFGIKNEDENFEGMWDWFEDYYPEIKTNEINAQKFPRTPHDILAWATGYMFVENNDEIEFHSEYSLSFDSSGRFKVNVKIDEDDPAKFKITMNDLLSKNVTFLLEGNGNDETLIIHKIFY